MALVPEAILEKLEPMGMSLLRVCTLVLFHYPALGLCV